MLSKIIRIEWFLHEFYAPAKAFAHEVYEFREVAAVSLNCPRRAFLLLAKKFHESDQCSSHVLLLLCEVLIASSRGFWQNCDQVSGDNAGRPNRR